MLGALKDFFGILPTLWLLSACGAAPPVAATPAEPAHCEITGTADELALRVVGIDVPNLVASDVPAGIALDLAPGATRVATHVLSPIELRGESALDEVHFVLERAVPGAPVALRAGAPVARAEVRDGALRGLVVLEGSRQTPAVSLYLSVGCADLALGDAAEPPPDDRAEGRPTHALATAQDLPLSAVPGGPIVVSLALADSYLPLQVEVVEERDGWSRIVRRFHWADLDGWVPSDRVEPTSDREWHLPNLSGWGGGRGCGRSEHPYAYRGPATVRGGTPVTDEHTGGVWGRFVADTEVEVGVRMMDATGMVEIIAAPGIESPECGDLEFDHAMVPRDAVVLPTAP